MEINIRSQIKKISKEYAKHEFYLFGSFIKNGVQYGDVDVLILYHTPEKIESIRNDFRTINTLEIFDLMFLDIEEEREINFVEKVKAVRL